MTAPTALKTFTFAPGLDLRSITHQEAPFFIASDVCAALDLAKTGTVLDSVDPDDKVRLNLGLRGQAPWLVSESGLYALIMRSRKPEAKAFQKWVTGTVLPAIRKNGGYMTPEVAVQAIESPANFMARALLMAQETINGLQKQAEGMSPEAVSL